jgi:4-diphosphocytidyl-2-C-methyl-D-erythritol kinase
VSGFPAPIRLHANAKLTLSLRVLGRRPDGFHDLDALVAGLADIHDVVDIALVDEPGVTLQVTGRTAGVPGGDDNLAAVAARRAFEMYRVKAGVLIHLDKAIPPGAGLGGGSADAAAVLSGLARLLRQERVGSLDRLAAELGSDVPVCLRGGLAWMRGRGELVEPLPLVGGWGVAVAVPPFGMETAAVYRKWDELGGPSSDRAVPAPLPLRQHVPELVNDLEPAALAVEPRLGDFRAVMEAAAGRPALLAGSGSAYVVACDGDEAPDVALSVREAMVREGWGELAVASRPAASGVVVVER